MRTIKLISSLAIFSAVMLFTQCERERYGCTDPRATNYDVAADVDDGSCYYGNDPIFYGECQPDLDGNLVISNRTGEKLYLYKGYVENATNHDAFIACIPADTIDFLVYIPNEELEVCLLQIWKDDDMLDINQPDLERVHRQWRVALSNSSAPAERANWLITGSDEVTGTGTLLLTYPDVDEFDHEVIYQVDILLNSQAGAKLASLQPGISNKKVSVDYGVQYLFYHYWYSDPNSSKGEIMDIGWAETPDIVINDSHKEAEIDIPIFSSIVGKYGELTVVNENNFVINVHADGKLIEDIAIVEGSSQGLSSIPPGDQTTFLVPVEEYIFSITDLAGKQEDEFKEVNIVQEENAILRSGVKKRTIRITNSTEYTLGLFNIQEEYLGLSIKAGDVSGSFTLPEAYDTLLVIDFGRTRVGGFNYSSSVNISSLENYLMSRIEMIAAWPLFDENYGSPLIADAESTIMEAQLINSESVELSFEYNVSSENGYDKFYFLVDGFTELDAISGESDWVRFSKTFNPGTHSLVWEYKKDQTRAEGRDNVLIRNIELD